MPSYPAHGIAGGILADRAGACNVLGVGTEQSDVAKISRRH
jgi:hypothetical protein